MAAETRGIAWANLRSSDTATCVNNDPDLLREIPTGSQHRLVLLHGWGADADDLLSLGRELCQGIDKPVERVALRAPQLHPHGIGRQWYGLFPADWAAVPDAVCHLQARLKALETPEIPLQATALLGFSQGGAMALASGCDLPLAGLICCSAYPHPNWMAPSKRPPVLLMHGRQDEVVPYSACEQLIRDLGLETSNIEMTLVNFDGGHGIPGELIPRMQQALSSWFH
ncbi:MAG TPA: alpha/beta hydrolase [Prochlorococcus sp.]|nr:prolyl oligopeptidase family serine peptidase [Prochlorococcaceae cyanobacterium ETNP14_MAG_4]HJL68617.1 prolyl oligopeptidase family serine peptidase [Prochlorococcaceae cyanobacterium Gl_MAG_24]